MNPPYNAPVNNQAPYMPSYNQAPYGNYNFPMHGGTGMDCN